MRRYIAAGFASQCWIVAAITLLIGCGSSVKPDPAIVRVVELSREQDREHVEEMVARDGSRWFVGSEPAIDLRHVDLGQSTVERCDDGFYLSLWLTAEGERRMHAWSKARIGRPFGVICDGVLPAPGNVPGVIRNAVTVMGYPTLEEASRTMAALRQTKRAMERAQRK